MECRDKLDKLIFDNFDGIHLSKHILENVIDEYGENTVMLVLANTVKDNISDGRYREKTKQWAENNLIDKDEIKYNFSLQTHPELVNGLVNQFINIQKSDNEIYGSDYCEKGSINSDYEQKLLILNPDIFSFEYRKGKYQLFYATSGFGCKPSTNGNKVFGFFLYDYESTSFVRPDFLGVAKEDKLPNWAKNKLKDIDFKSVNSMNYVM